MAPMESDVHARDVEKQVKSGLDDLVARELCCVKLDKMYNQSLKVE